jgi:hypothetical protein
VTASTSFHVRSGLPRPTATAATLALRGLAAAAALTAAGIHLSVAPEHLREWWVYGAFFVTVTVAQVALALLILQSSRLLVVLGGIWGTVALIGIYVASRTTGLPLTPPGGHVHVQVHHLPVAGGIGNGIPVIPGLSESNVESIGSLDLAALGAELLLVVVLVALLPVAARRLTTNLMLGGAVAAWVGVIAVTLG